MPEPHRLAAGGLSSEVVRIFFSSFTCDSGREQPKHFLTRGDGFGPHLRILFYLKAIVIVYFSCIKSS